MRWAASAAPFSRRSHQNIYPASYSVVDLVNFMLYCFLGGLDYVLGPAVGAFLLVIGFEVLHGLQEYQSLMYGILMIAVILWLPNGILSLRRRDRGGRITAPSADRDGWRDRRPDPWRGLSGVGP